MSGAKMNGNAASAIDVVRKSVRPGMLAILAIIIGPMALVTGTLETLFPNAGTRFAEGFSAYLAGLPDAFWMFAASAFGFYTVARSFGSDKKLEAEREDMARDHYQTSQYADDWSADEGENQ